MTGDAVPATTSNHPSPHRHKVGVPVLMFGVSVGPIAWLTQEIANYALVAQTCFPNGASLGRTLPTGSQLWFLLTAIDIAAIALAVLGAAVSSTHWRATRDEHRGNSGVVLEAGEGRTQFIALWGVLTGLGFLAATLFNMIPIFVVPQCGP